MKKGRQEGFSSASHYLATASPTRSRRLSAAVGALEDERKKQDDNDLIRERTSRISEFERGTARIAVVLCFATKGLNVNVRVCWFGQISPKAEYKKYMLVVVHIPSSLFPYIHHSRRIYRQGGVTRRQRAGMNLSLAVELLASVKLSGTLTAVELGRWMLLDGAPAVVPFACPTDTLGAALVDVVELRASETLLAVEADFNWLMELVIGAVLLALVADILWDVADGLDLAEVLGPTDVLDLADTLDFADALDLAEALDREAVLVTLKPATTSPSALGGPYHQRVV
ncbi:hypothetical protein B0H11DRAFT_2197591 [Mycena galericulata]|nr:hypothetical protein B0H11DRAFT_2197591 [Mycena galericulata]